MSRSRRKKQYPVIPERSLHDVIVLLLAKLLPTSQSIVPRSRLDKALYAASQRFSGIFDNLMFDTNGSSPISRRLHEMQAMFSLSGIFESRFINGIGDVYRLNPKMRKELLKSYGKSARFFPRGLIAFVRRQLAIETD